MFGDNVGSCTHRALYVNAGERLVDGGQVNACPVLQGWETGELAEI